MGLRETWNDLDTGGKILVGFGVGAAALVIAIVVTVVLAAVIASFVLGVGDPGGAQDTPQASFGFDTADDLTSATITHEGGDTIQADRLTIEVGGRTVDWEGVDAVSAGDSTTVETQPGETITLVWQGEEESATLAQFVVPES